MYWKSDGLNLLIVVVLLATTQQRREQTPRKVAWKQVVYRSEGKQKRRDGGAEGGVAYVRSTQARDIPSRDNMYSVIINNQDRYLTAASADVKSVRTDRWELNSEW